MVNYRTSQQRSIFLIRHVSVLVVAVTCAFAAAQPDRTVIGAQAADTCASSIAASGDASRDGYADLGLSSPNGINPSTAESVGVAYCTEHFKSATSASALLKLAPGLTASSGFGGPLSPNLRTWIQFLDGNGPGSSASDVITTTVRSSSAISGFSSPLVVANSHWSLSSNRVDWTSAALKLRLANTDFADANSTNPVNAPRIYRAGSVSGPWTMLSSNFDGQRNTVTADTSSLGYFVVVKNTDTTPPLISIGSPTPSLTNNGPVDFTVTYTDADTVTLDESNVTVHATGSAAWVDVVISGTGTATRTITLSGLSGNGTLSVEIAAGTAADAAGNLAATANSSSPVTVDNIVPSFIDVFVSPMLVTPGMDVTVTFEVSEPLSSDPEVGVGYGYADLVSHTGNAYTYSYNVQEGDQSAIPSLWISGSDLAGNPAYSDWSESPLIVSVGAHCELPFTLTSGSGTYLLQSSQSTSQQDCTEQFNASGNWFSIEVPAWSRLDTYLTDEGYNGMVGLAIYPNCGAPGESCSADYFGAYSYWENRSSSAITVRIFAQSVSLSDTYLYAETAQLPDGTACTIPKAASCDNLYGGQWYANPAVHQVEGFSYDMAPCAVPPVGVTTPVSRWFSIAVPPQQYLTVESCDPEFEWTAVALYDACSTGALACADSGTTAGCATVQYANTSDTTRTILALSTFGPNTLFWTTSFSCDTLPGASCGSPMAATCGSEFNETSPIPGHQVETGSTWAHWLSVTVPPATRLFVTLSVPDDLGNITIYGPNSNCSNWSSYGDGPVSVTYDNVSFTTVTLPVRIQTPSETIPGVSITCEAILPGTYCALPYPITCGVPYGTGMSETLPFSSTDVASCAYRPSPGTWVSLALPPWQSTEIGLHDANVDATAIESYLDGCSNYLSCDANEVGSSYLNYENATDTTRTIHALLNLYLLSDWLLLASCDEVEQTCLTATPIPLGSGRSLGTEGFGIAGTTSHVLPCFPSLSGTAGHWFQAQIPPRAALTIKVEADAGTSVGLGWIKDGSCVSGSSISDCQCGTTSITRTLHNASDTTASILALANYLATAHPKVVATRADVPLLVCSWQHVLALKGDGSIYGWGGNWTGQLGLGNYSSKLSPVALSSSIPRPVKDMGAYTYMSSFVGADGLIRSCGANDDGQLGDLTTTTRNIPVVVKNNDGTTLTEAKLVAMGASQSLAVRGSDNSVWAWGRNNWGQLGDGTQTDRLGAVRVQYADGTPLTSAIAIASGYGTNMALLSDGTIRSWGYGNSGSNGNGLGGAQLFPSLAVKRNDSGTTLSGVIAIASFAQGGMALDNAGIAWAWGTNRWGAEIHGILGSGNDIEYSSYARPVKLDASTTLTGVVAISGHSMSGYAVTGDGKIYGWGSNISGQLGLGQAAVGQTYDWPQRIQFPESAGDVRIISGKVGGQLFGQAIDITGMRWAWGTNNGVGWIGDGTGSSRFTPTQALPLP